ncbi:AAA family ATPase [Nakamurella sp. YIM 132087]|uniref:AAA family ATPase n=1 Tax=Nakamurella alba TaxID=2665158 RepID=A0A7K1FT98_9ACTN|nr:AAA family ATPase [Nakamurella alba]MTD16403.1 AAA family ATPase [Nakamurella alba]
MTGPRVLVTGMSATGKSTVIGLLAARGFAAVDTDLAEWCVDAVSASGAAEQLWDEPRIGELLDSASKAPLFVSGCHSNQGRFRHRFDHVVLLSTPTPILLQRLSTRTTNDFGKSAAERERILGHIGDVEPLLRASADLEIDTSRHGPDDVVEILLGLAGQPAATGGRSANSPSSSNRRSDGDAGGAV